MNLIKKKKYFPIKRHLLFLKYLCPPVKSEWSGKGLILCIPQGTIIIAFTPPPFNPLKLIPSPN